MKRTLESDARNDISMKWRNGCRKKRYMIDTSYKEENTLQNDESTAQTCTKFDTVISACSNGANPTILDSILANSPIENKNGWGNDINVSSNCFLLAIQSKNLLLAQHILNIIPPFHHIGVKERIMDELQDAIKKKNESLVLDILNLPTFKRFLDDTTYPFQYLWYTLNDATKHGHLAVKYHLNSIVKLFFHSKKMKSITFGIIRQVNPLAKQQEEIKEIYRLDFQWNLYRDSILVQRRRCSLPDHIGGYIASFVTAISYDSLKEAKKQWCSRCCNQNSTAIVDIMTTRRELNQVVSGDTKHAIDIPADRITRQ